MQSKKFRLVYRLTLYSQKRSITLKRDFQTMWQYHFGLLYLKKNVKNKTISFKNLLIEVIQNV